jgi:hypothetical protein
MRSTIQTSQLLAFGDTVLRRTGGSLGVREVIEQLIRLLRVRTLGLDGVRRELGIERERLSDVFIDERRVDLPLRTEPTNAS